MKDFDGLPTDLKAKIVPFDKNCNMASTDALNRVQRAYVKWFSATHKHLSPSEMVPLVMEMSFQDGIFDGTETYDDKDLKRFLQYRLGYERKKDRVTSKQHKKRKSLDELTCQFLKK